jgi:hypothetical protein
MVGLGAGRSDIDALGHLSFAHAGQQESSQARGEAAHDCVSAPRLLTQARSVIRALRKAG